MISTVTLLLPLLAEVHCRRSSTEGGFQRCHPSLGFRFPEAVGKISSFKLAFIGLAVVATGLLIVSGCQHQRRCLHLMEPSIIVNLSVICPIVTVSATNSC